jgi:hypothetical protein
MAFTSCEIKAHCVAMLIQGRAVQQTRSLRQNQEVALTSVMEPDSCSLITNVDTRHLVVLPQRPSPKYEGDVRIANVDRNDNMPAL